MASKSKHSRRLGLGLGLVALALITAAPLSAQGVEGFDFLGRTALGGGLAEYSFELRVGPGEHDIVGLHRVVLEKAPGVPARNLPGVFMVHGDAWAFDAAFFSDADSIAPFLAGHGVDVWGIDLRWTKVPETVADFSFMAAWGLDTGAKDVAAGLLAARVARAVTGSGAGKLFLLGWSRGGLVGYSYLNLESQLPPGLRQVRGFIPVDIYLKTDDPSLTADACTRRDLLQSMLDAGQYQDPTGQLASLVGTLAEIDPTGASPIFPGLTNRQGALLLGAATFTILPGGLPPVPVYHLTAGTFDATGLPDGLIYTAEGDWTTTLQGAFPFGPNRIVLDTEKTICGVDDVPFDDHLDDVTVPVLYVGAGGGFGDFGIHTTTLLGSTDVTTLVVSFEPPAARLADFGHSDLFLAPQAETLVWQPILEWILSR